MKETVDELKPGTLLAERYEIGGPISSGAMGAVYRASDREADTEVAIKRLLDVRHAERFEIEARLLSQLRHPRVVEVLDHFQEETGQYVVMELVAGTDLGKILKQRGEPGLPAAEATNHVLEACEALQYVHDQLIVHRDIKPENLVFGPSGVIVVDFGIARELGDKEEDVGTIGVGTPRYMAPEILAGGAVSPRADVYGLAATLWTLLTGEPPAYDDMTKLAETIPGVTPDLEAAVRAGLEFVPERRTTSIAAFAAALGSPLGDGRGESLARSVPEPSAPEDLIERIVFTAAGVFDAAACSVALTDRATGELVYQSAWGAGAREIVGIRLPPGKGIGGAVAQSGTPEACDCRNDERFQAQIAEGTGYVPVSMLVVPLKRGDDTIGVLSLLDRRDGGQYGLEDAERAGLFADLTVTALDLQHRSS